MSRCGEAIQTSSQHPSQRDITQHNNRTRSYKPGPVSPFRPKIENFTLQPYGIRESNGSRIGTWANHKDRTTNIRVWPNRTIHRQGLNPTVLIRLFFAKLVCNDTLHCSAGASHPPPRITRVSVGLARLSVHSQTLPDISHSP